MTCSHGFEKASQCVECMLDGPVDNAWHKIGKAIRTKFAQSCADCGQSIPAGQWAQRWDRGDPATLTVYTCPLCEPS